MLHKLFITALVFICCYTTVDGQIFKVGSTYFGKDNYVEYLAGNAPLVISVPHGGYLDPVGMPNRDCVGCSYTIDSYTQELSRLVQVKFFERTGCYPHMVYNLLHRKKLDMNRELLEATDANTILDKYWYEYHTFIDSAKSAVTKGYGKGLFVEIHGHGHTKQRIELGYLVSQTTLGLADSLINLPKYAGSTSIRNLANRNLQSLNHVSLLRGPLSMGTLLQKKGFLSVPSSSDPFPLATDDYFNGGYNTLRHGSNTEGKIDAIQLELYSSIRFDSVERNKFADSLVRVLINYLDFHYFTNYSKTSCILTSVENINQEPSALEIYPNPTTNLINIKTTLDLNSYAIFDSFGQLLASKSIFKPTDSISLATLPSGFMYIIFFDNKNKTYCRKVFKQ